MAAKVEEALYGVFFSFESFLFERVFELWDRGESYHFHLFTHSLSLNFLAMQHLIVFYGHDTNCVTTGFNK